MSMTMTLDEVRKTRFHMSRRNGYEVTDVDIFVDKVEETIQTLSAEIESLKKNGGVADNSAETDQLKKTLARTQADSEKASAEIERLQSELDYLRNNAADGDGSLRREIDSLRAQVADAHHRATAAQSAQAAAEAATVQALQAAASPVQDPNLVAEVEYLRAQLAEANASHPQDYVQLTGENQQLRAQVNNMLAAPKDLSSLSVTTSPEASSAVVRLVQLATEQAESLVGEATVEAARRRQAAQDEITRTREETDAYAARVKFESDAHAAQVKSEAQFAAEEMTRKATEMASQVVAEANVKAEQTEVQARSNAEKLVKEAQNRASTIDSDAASRRKELFTALESERDILFTKIEKLRTYEKSYRQTMTGYLKSQIERLSSSQFAPEETPELLQSKAHTAQEWTGEMTGSTPRLDALLGTE